MGKAKHPHDASRPTPKAILRAIEKQDSKALRLALTPRQRRFAEEYIVDYNGAAAAIRAGYAVPYADRQAHLLLKHEGIAAYLDVLTASKNAKIMSLSPDYLVQRLAEIINREGVRTADELRAIEMAMKHLGMFVDKTEITGKDGGAIAIENQKIDEEAQAFKNIIQQMSEKNKEKVLN